VCVGGGVGVGVGAGAGVGVGVRAFIDLFETTDGLLTHNSFICFTFVCIYTFICVYTFVFFCCLFICLRPRMGF